MQSTLNTVVTTNHKLPEQIDQTCSLSLRTKIVLFVIVPLLLIAAVLAVWLTVYYSPSIVVISRSETQFYDGSIYGISNLKLEDRNIFEPDISYEFYVTYPIQTKQGRRLQEGFNKAFIHYFDKDTGITIKLNLQGSNSSYFVNTKVFVDFVNDKLSKDKNNKDNQRIKAEDPGFLSELGQIFSSSLSKSTDIQDSQVKFQIITMVNLKISSAKGLQYDTNQKNQIRKLLESEIRNLNAFAKESVLKSIIAKIAGFFINTIRKYGPQIGKVIGFVAAAKSGNISKAAAIMKTGQKIGSAAASLVNSCIPQGDMKISCPPNLIGNILAQFGGEEAIFSAIGQLFGNFKGPVTVKNIKDFLKTIPSSALAKFAFGLPVAPIQEK